MPNYKSYIRKKFRDYNVSVDYLRADDEYCDRYYITFWDNDVDDYAIQLLDELWDECHLAREEHYEENGCEVWLLI